jgi:hypothetical protein
MDTADQEIINKINSYSDLFDECQVQFREEDSEKNGALAFLNDDSVSEIASVLIDMAIQARYMFIKIMLMQEGLEQTPGSQMGGRVFDKEDK